MPKKQKQFTFLKDHKAERKGAPNQNFSKGKSYYLTAAQVEEFGELVVEVENEGAPQPEASS